MTVDQRLWRTVCAGIAVLAAFPLNARGQEPSFDFDVKRYPTGLQTSPQESLAEFPLPSVTRAYIPEAIDLSSRFPAPGRQVHGSCSAWAVGYGARSYYAALEQGKSQPDERSIASPADIYNRIWAAGKTSLTGTEKGKPECSESGSAIRDALALLIKEGAASLADYDADATCNTEKAPVSPSRGFRIPSAQLLSLLPKRPFSPDLVKQTLAAGHPVIIGLKIDAAFVSLKPGDVYEGWPGFSLEKYKDAPGHAVVLAGYDERRRAYRVFNSWGPEWADGGFGWISEDALKAQAVEAWRMAATVTPPKPPLARPVSPGVSVPEPFRVLIQEASCSDLQISMQKDTLEKRDDKEATGRITGFVSRAEDWRTLKALAQVHGMIDESSLRPWPICEAMLTLREPLRAASAPKIEIDGGALPLGVGQTFSFRVKPPNVPSFLYVFYIEDDGTVVNLLPRSRPVRSQTDPKGAALVFGDGKDGRPTFRVSALKSKDSQGHLREKDDPERGHEAVIALAARSPIEELEDREDQEKTQGKSGAAFYRVAAAQGDAPQDRLFLTMLKDIVSRRKGADTLPREVSASILHLKISD